MRFVRFYFYRVIQVPGSFPASHKRSTVGKVDVVHINQENKKRHLIASCQLILTRSTDWFDPNKIAVMVTPLVPRHFRAK